MSSGVSFFREVPLSEILPVLETKCIEVLKTASQPESLSRKERYAVASKVALLCFLKNAEIYFNDYGLRSGSAGWIAPVGRQYYLPNSEGTEDPELDDLCMGFVPLGGDYGDYLVNLGSKNKIEIVTLWEREGIDNVYDFSQKEETLFLWPNGGIKSIQIITALATYTIPHTEFPKFVHHGSWAYDDDLNLFLDDTRNVSAKFLNDVGHSHLTRTVCSILYNTAEHTKMVMMSPFNLKSPIKIHDLSCIVQEFKSVHSNDLKYTGASSLSEVQLAYTASKIYLLSFLTKAYDYLHTNTIVMVGRGYYLPKSAGEKNINYSRMCLGVLHTSIGPTLINLGGSNPIQLICGDIVSDFTFCGGGAIPFQLLGSVSKIKILEKEEKFCEVDHLDFPYEYTKNNVDATKSSCSQHMLQFLRSVKQEALRYCTEKKASDRVKFGVETVHSRTLQVFEGR